jgi:hypothetical protein
VESKWKNDHITTFPGQSLSKTGLSLEEAMDLSRDRLIEEDMNLGLLPAYGGFLLYSLFDPEDGGDMFLRNVGLSSNNTDLQSRGLYSS